MTEAGRHDTPRGLIHVSFRAQDAAVRMALLAVDASLRDRLIDRDLRDRTQIALAEACNNIVEHAYGFDGTEQAMITLDIAHDQDGVQITLRDHGGPMPHGHLPDPVLPAINPDDLPTLPEGGFGWPLLRGMAHALCLSRQKGQNILRFRLPIAALPGQKLQDASRLPE